jgi:hypothetical protein
MAPIYPFAPFLHQDQPLAVIALRAQTQLGGQWRASALPLAQAGC